MTGKVVRGPGKCQCGGSARGYLAQYKVGILAAGKSVIYLQPVIAQRKAGAGMEIMSCRIFRLIHGDGRRKKGRVNRAQAGKIILQKIAVRKICRAGIRRK